MRRNASFEEISDGRLYDSNDMVKAECGGCKGCSACCHGMGNTIVLDPYDVFRLTTGLNQTFEELLSDSRIELNVVDGVILPDIAMAGEEEACSFLNEEGRCSIHAIRPGICRLFPLGRIYENGGFKYFNQIHECVKPNKTKVKVRKWIDTPDIVSYEQFVTKWHYFLKALEEKGKRAPQEEGQAKAVAMYVLKAFYLIPFEEGRDFYEQFDGRLCRAEEELGLLPSDS